MAMAGLLAPPPHSYASPLLHKPLLPRSFPLSYRRNPRIPLLPPPSAGKPRRIRIDRSSAAAGDDDEEPSPRPPLLSSAFTDEWGERSDPEPEPPAQPDPPNNDDEWGSDGPSAAAAAAAAAAAEKAVVDDKVEELKRCLVDTFYGTELGFRAAAEVRGEIVELVIQLEARNPTPAPNQSPELLDGNWILLYTAFSELLPLLAVGATPALKIIKISQSIDSKSRTIVNATTLASPFATFSFSASASFEVQSPSRIQVQFKEGSFQPPEVSSTLDLPEKLELFGQKIDLQTVKQSLNPIQQAVANISRGISGQPPLKVPIPGNRAKSWLLTTYLDHDFRISRGDGGLFVLAKEGSPLLDQLS